VRALFDGRNAIQVRGGVPLRDVFVRSFGVTGDIS
jgi:hypothetical protein